MKMAENSLHQGVVFNGTTGGGGGSATFMGDLEFTGGNIGVSWQITFTKTIISAWIDNG